MMRFDVWKRHDRKGEVTMMLTFALPDGTLAGIVPTHELWDHTLEQLGLTCLAPSKDASVVFYVPDWDALNRIRARFGLKEC
jgi:hypothetical protein